MYKCLAIGCHGITGVISTKDAIRIRKCHSCGCQFKTSEEFLQFVDVRSRGKTEAPAFEMAAEIVWSGAE